MTAARSPVTRVVVKGGERDKRIALDLEAWRRTQRLRPHGMRLDVFFANLINHREV